MKQQSAKKSKTSILQTVGVTALVVLSILILSGCNGKDKEPNSNQPSQGYTDSDTEITSEDVDAYEVVMIEDTNDLLSDKTKRVVSIYNASWDKKYQERVYITTAEEDADQKAWAEAKRENDDVIRDTDTVIVLDVYGGDAYVDVGAKSILKDSALTEPLSSSIGTVDEMVMLFFQNADVFYTNYAKQNGDENAELTDVSSFMQKEEEAKSEEEPTDPEETEDPEAAAKAEEERQNKLATYQEMADATAASFESVAGSFGLLAIDVSQFNQDVYPNSKIVQAGDGHVDIYMAYGDRDEAETFWAYSYNDALANADTGTFEQRYNPGDLDMPRSVEGVVDGNHIKCILYGNIAILAETKETDPQYWSLIELVLDALDVPEIPTVVY